MSVGFHSGGGGCKTALAVVVIAGFVLVFCNTLVSREVDGAIKLPKVFIHCVKLPGWVEEQSQVRAGSGKFVL